MLLLKFSKALHYLNSILDCYIKEETSENDSLPRYDEKFTENVQNEIKVEENNSLKQETACDLCNIPFSHTKTLKKHYKSAHQNYVPEKSKQKKSKEICKECGKKFNRKKYLDLHLKYVHEGIKDTKCDICGKDFTKASLARHKKGVHCDKKDHKCEFCGKEFAFGPGVFNYAQYLAIHTAEEMLKNPFQYV